MTTTKKTRSPEYAAAFAAHYAAQQAHAFAEMDRQSAEVAYLNNANRYSHGLRKSQALRSKLEACEKAVEAARVVAESALATFRAVKAAETQAAA
jgi:hypothetical protein